MKKGKEIGMEGGEKESSSRARARACGCCLRWPLTEQRATQKTKGNVGGQNALTMQGSRVCSRAGKNRCSIDDGNVYVSMTPMMYTCVYDSVHVMMGKRCALDT